MAVLSVLLSFSSFPLCLRKPILYNVIIYSCLVVPTILRFTIFSYALEDSIDNRNQRTLLLWLLFAEMSNLHSSRGNRCEKREDSRHKTEKARWYLYAIAYANSLRYRTAKREDQAFLTENKMRCNIVPSPIKFEETLKAVYLGIQRVLSRTVDNPK